MKNSSSDFNINKNKGDKNNFSISKILSFRWMRILFLITILVIIFLIFSQITEKIILLVFTCVPLFLGFAFSYLTEPIYIFLKKYFSEKYSKIISFFIISFFIISFFILIIMLFFHQLGELYNSLLKEIPNNKDIKIFFEGIKEKRITSSSLLDNETDKLTLIYDKTNKEYMELTYKLVNGDGGIIRFKTQNLSGLFILLIKALENSYLRPTAIKLISFFYENANNRYLDHIWSRFDIIFTFFYIFIFTLFIAAFSMRKGQKFYSKIWDFFTKNMDFNVKEKLKFELSKNLKSWSKGLFIEQSYVFLGTLFFTFLAGIIYEKSGFKESFFALAFLMLVFNLIPYIGPWIGIIPIVGLGLSNAITNDISLINSWVPFIIAVGGVILIQLGQSLLVSPLVYSQQLKIGPITIIMVLAVFFALFGAFSMIFALPIILIIKTVLSVVYKKEWNI